MGNPIYQEPKSRREFTHVYIQLRVRDHSGSDVYFKMKRRLPLGLLQDAYCQREQLDLSKLCFLYKGRRIVPDETPEELDMEQVVSDALLPAFFRPSEELRWQRPFSSDPLLTCLRVFSLQVTVDVVRLEE